HTPAPADVDAVIRQVRHLVVLDVGVGDVGGQDPGHVLVVLGHAADEVVRQGDVLVGHRGVRGVVGVGLDAADHDAGARVVGEGVVVRGDSGGPQAGAGGDRVVVLADAQADLAEVGEGVAAEGDVRGGRDLYRGGRLVP